MTDLCEQVIDEEEGQLCNEPAVHEITVSNRSGKFVVLVCAKHKALHNQTYAALRANRK